MKLTRVITAAILAYTVSAAPVAILPPAPSSANLTSSTRGSPQSLDEGPLPPANFTPIPLSVAPDGIIAPGPLKSDTTATGLPFDRHPDNLENFPPVYPDTMSPDGTFNTHIRHLQHSGQGNAAAAKFAEDSQQQFGENASADILERSPMSAHYPYDKYAKQVQTRAKGKIIARAKPSKPSNPSPDIEVRRQETLRKSEEYRCRLLWDVDDIVSSMQGPSLLNPFNPAFWSKYTMTEMFIPLGERFTNVTLEQCAPMESGNGISQLKSHSRTNRCQGLQDTRDVAYQWGDEMTPASASQFFIEAETQAGITLVACHQMQDDRNHIAKLADNPTSGEESTLAPTAYIKRDRSTRPERRPGVSQRLIKSQHGRLMQESLGGHS